MAHPRMAGVHRTVGLVRASVTIRDGIVAALAANRVALAVGVTLVPGARARTAGQTPEGVRAGRRGCADEKRTAILLARAIRVGRARGEHSRLDAAADRRREDAVRVGGIERQLCDLV